MLTHVRRGLRELWRIDRPLTALGLLMIGETVTAMILMVVDGRTIAGAPAWLKPAKFGASTAIYSLTLAWIFGFLPGWRRLRRFVSLTTSIILSSSTCIVENVDSPPHSPVPSSGRR